MLDPAQGARRASACAVALAASLAFLQPAMAQDKTFYLDRLQMAGAPEDGIAVWRPQMSARTRFYGQLGLGFAMNPLRIEDVVESASERDKARGQVGTPVTAQLIEYATVGVELADRIGLQVELPAAVLETGNGASHAPFTSSSVDLKPAALMDARLTGRVILLRSPSRTFKLGLDASLWIPTGNAYSYGGDGAVSGRFGLAGEIDLKRIAFTLDAAVHARPSGQIDDLRTGTEALIGLGAFAPIGDLPVRLGAEIFGGTGLSANTVFGAANTPLEWMVEARANPDRARRVWVGLSAGTRLTAGYAPDVRIVSVVGYAFELGDTAPPSPHERFRTVGAADRQRDQDDFAQAVDSCPEGEAGPFPGRGCLPDRDRDGIPDAEDACPTVPGKRSSDPAKNGCPEFIDAPEGSSTITVLKQIEFDTGKATILPRSYPILDEILAFLRANPDVTRLDVEGHTDNRGPAALNERLSSDRANAVRTYLVEHGVVPGRLTAAGYGPHHPIADNGTREGRQKNRRVDFKLAR